MPSVITKFKINYPYIAKYYDEEKNENDIYSVKCSDMNKVYWKCNKGHSFQESVYYFTSKKKFECPICSYKIIIKGVNTLDVTHPHLHEEYSHNNIKPLNEYHYGSNERVLWICSKCGGEYSCQPIQKTQRNPCPYCNKTKFLKGFNSVKEIHPQLAKEWSSKNEKKAEDTFCNDYELEVIWKCSVCGYEYNSQLGNRTGFYVNSCHCPSCYGEVFDKSCNSFAVVAPHLVKYWGKRNRMAPEDAKVNRHSFNNFYFICDKCGGEYLLDYVYKDTDEDICPYCSDKYVLDGLNSVADKYHKLVDEWHKSNEKTPNNVLYLENSNILWKCKACERNYYLTIQEKVSGKECPYCLEKEILYQTNSLSAKYPELITEWSIKNNLLPNEVLSDSRIKYWWRCKICTGEFTCTINDKKNEDSCPYCAGRKVLEGYNSLDVTNPYLAKEWSNNNARPITDFMTTSSYNAIWKCPTCKGEYEYPIRDREMGDSSCPYCSDKKVLVGFNSFKARNPDLMESWDFINNYLLCNPDEIGNNYNQNVWWYCKNNKNHKYKCSPKKILLYRKRNIEPCTYCKGLRRKKRHFI